MRTLIFSAILFSVFLLSAQKPSIQWQEKVGFTNDDEFYRVLNSGGSFAVAGMYRTINDLPQSWLLSFSVDGIIYREKKYIYEGNNLINSICLNNDYSFTFSGYTYERKQYVRDLFFTRVTSAGKTIFRKVNGGKFKDGASDILALGDGGNIILGYFSDNENQDLWIMRVSKYGNEMWKKTYDFSTYDNAVGIAASNDRNILVCSNNFNKENFWEINFSYFNIENGILGWQKKIESDKKITANDFIKTMDSCYVICGVVESQDKAKDFWIAKTNEQAEIVWEKNYGWSMNEEANGIFQRYNGNYLVCGYTESKGEGMYDFWVMELDAEGNIIWESTYGTEANDIAYDITESDDDGIVVVGSTFNGDNKLDGWIIKLK